MNKVIGYQEKNTPIHKLSGLSKLIFLIIITLSTMVTYNTFFIALVCVLGIVCCVVSKIEFKRIKTLLLYVMFFAILNILLIFLFSPEHGVSIYGTRHVLAHLFGKYYITSEQLFYTLNLVLKYIASLPFAMIFLLTTNPSELAASLNKIGIPYRFTYAVSLTLRYIPDMQESLINSKNSMAQKGLEISKKGKLTDRIKGNVTIVIPLIISSIDKIQTIATAMELRRFGKNKKRTWYCLNPFKKTDYLLVVFGFLMLFIMIILFVINNGRYYNPFI